MARTRQLQDFIGFQFNGRHSSEFGLKIVSNSNRFQDNFGPTFKDNTVKVPGGNGNFYWSTEDDKKEWNLSVAFDDVNEVELREMRQWLNSKAMGELIFDEEPYKAYKVKMKSPAQFKYLCFDKEIQGDEPYTSTLIHNHTLAPSQESMTPAPSSRNVERVYKGEGTIAFVAYQPYAESVYEYLEDYIAEGIENVDEWKEASGLLYNEYDHKYIPGIFVPVNDTLTSKDDIQGIETIPSLGGTAMPFGRVILTLNPRNLVLGGLNQNSQGTGFKFAIESSSDTNIFTSYSMSSQLAGQSNGLGNSIISKFPWVPGQIIRNLCKLATGKSDLHNNYTSITSYYSHLYFYNSPSEGYPCIYNPGDLPVDWTWTIPATSTATTATLYFKQAYFTNSTTLSSSTLATIELSSFTAHTNSQRADGLVVTDSEIEVSSRTELCRGTVNRTYTTGLYNKYLTKAAFFKVPVTRAPDTPTEDDPFYYIEMTGPTGMTFKYKYLYY